MVGAGVSTVREVVTGASESSGDGVVEVSPLQPDRASRQAVHSEMSFYKGKALPSISWSVKNGSSVDYTLSDERKQP